MNQIILETHITFPSQDIVQTIDLMEMGTNQYRVVDAVSVLTEVVKFGDVIEVKHDTNGDLIFQRIIESSAWQSEVFMLSREISASDKLRTLLQQVENVGGHWEQVFGGALVVCLPPNSLLDIKTAYQALDI